MEKVPQLKYGENSTTLAGEHDISWALKLLEREHDYEPNFITKHWSRIWCSVIGVAVPVGVNFWLRRPTWTGIHRHLIGGSVGFGLGHLLTMRERFVLARRDAIYRDYIRLHPEDFPPPDTRKYADIFQPWQPIR